MGLGYLGLYLELGEAEIFRDRIRGTLDIDPLNKVPV